MKEKAKLKDDLAITAFIRYKDWLIKKRGFIKPEIGDRVVFYPFDKTSYYIYTREDLKDDLFDIIDYFVEIKINL